jgi:hypothetical protein
MATQNVNIGVNVSDNGTAKKVVKNFQEITAAATQAQRAAQSIPVKSTLAPGGTSGSRKASEPTGTQGMMSGEEYGRARGSTGATGASARDFANQAQGLGGLVRLYATYAANLFAVSAAFSALKNAADTTNLVKGMDQLGASSGIALGTLSKRLVDVTDGAISMREAMETVTKATSSGLSSKQILELGNVAKKASQALGVGMEDAVSRLTRGITKLEPELLDELGIFTKIDPAVQKYAQSIGKATSALSDFERRQAFAIAVLSEGNKKFGELELDANPYSKLLATLKNVSQSILEVVNVAVVPLVSYLSKSPTALLTVLAGIAAIIVKQALPAFGQFKAGLENAAESAQKRALARAEDAKAAQISIAESVRKAADARVEAQVDKVVAAEAKINSIKSSSINKQSTLYKILEKDLESITDRDLKRIESSAKGLDTRGLVDQAKAYRDTAQAVRDYQAEKRNYDVALKREEQQLQKNVKWYSIEGITMATAEAAKRQAVRASIISNAAYQASLVGVTRAMIAVNAAIVQQGIVGFDALTLRVKAGAAAIGGALATIGTAVNKFLGVIAVLTTIYSLVDGFLDGASEQVGKFDGAVDKAKASAENLYKTYQKIYQNDPFSAQSVQARGNALMEVADGFKEVAEAASAAQKVIDQSWWASLKEGIGITGVNSNFGKSIATQLTAVLKTLDDPEAKRSLESTAISQLGITELSFDKIAAAAKKVGASSPEIKKLQDALLGLATQAKIAGVASAQFGESYSKVTDQISKINQKFAVSDDIAMFAINSGNAINDLDTLLSQGITKSVDGLVTALDGISKGTNIFGNMSTELMPLIDTAKSFKREFSEGTKEVENLKARLDELNSTKIDPNKFKKVESGQEMYDPQAFYAAVRELERQRAQSVADLAKAEQKTQKAKSELEVVASKVQQALPKALADSTNLLGVRLAGQLAKGSTQVLQGAYASFDAIPELVAKSSQLKLREIDAQIANTKALRDLTTQTVLSAAQQKVLSAETGLASADSASKAVAATKLDEAKTELQLLETAVTNPIKALKQLAVEQENNTELGKRLGSQVKELAARTVEYTGSLRQLGQQRLGEQLEGRIAVNNARIKQEQNLLKLQQEDLKLGADKLNLLAQQENIGLDLKEQLNSQIALNRENQADLAYRQRVIELAKTYSEQVTRASVLPEAARKTAMKGALDTYDAGTAQADAQKTQDLEKSRLDLLKAQTLVAVERINLEEAAYNRAADFAKASTDNQLQLKQLKLDTELGVQDVLLANEQIVESARIEIQYQSSLKTAALDKERAQILANQEFERQQTANTFAIRKILAADTGEDGLLEETKRKIQEITEQERVQKTVRDGALAQADGMYNKTVAIADATRQMAVEQDKYNQLIKTTTEIAESLKTVFGKVGEAVGTLATTLIDVAKSTADRAKAEETLQAAIAAEGDPKAKKKLEEQFGKQKAANAKAELTDNIKLISSAKNLFKEKTGAYKVLAGIEKAMHMYKMAMFVKEAGMELWAMGKSVYASLTKTTAKTAEAGVDGVAAVVKAIASLPFPLNIAAGAATAAVVAGLLSSIGARGPSVSGGGFVPDAEQRQETQGTAMGYDSNGNKVQVRRGVFGDTDAKSESIANSLELIRETSVDGLSYDNKMVTLLESIDRGINKTAKSLYSIEGLRTGSMFGTVQGTQSGGGLLGTGVFGSKTSRTITDSGLLIEGTFAQLASDTNKAVIDFFEQVTVSKKSWYGKTKTWVEVKREEIDNATSQFFQDIFGNATLLLKEAGNKAGVVSTEIDAILGSMQLNDYFISLRGLKGEDFEKELGSVISSILDDASSAIFESFEKFAEFGEGMLETVNRVIDTNTKVNQQVKNVLGKSITESLNISGVVVPVYREAISYSLSKLGEEASKVVTDEIATSYDSEFGGWSYYTGRKIESPLKNLSQDQLKALVDAGSEFAVQVVDKTLEGYTTSFDNKLIQDLSFEITETLVELAGGLDAFLEQSNFFREKFMTESERLLPTQMAVIAQMARLGYASVDTREEFKDLVQSLDLTTKKGQEDYQALMNVAEGFDRVTSATEALQDNLKSMQMRILELTGSAEEVLAAQRASTLEDTDPNLRAVQQYIFALEDVKTAEENLTKARQAEANTLKEQQKASESSIAGLKRYIDSIFKFKNSLLLGSVSPLTPAEKYAEAKKQFDAILATATGTAVTPAEISAKEAALSQLEGSASAFLEASKAYNASSETYQTDFSYVQKALTTASESLAQQLTAEEKTLESLTKQLTALETLNNSTLSVADAVYALGVAMAKATALQPAATGQMNNVAGGTNLSTMSSEQIQEIAKTSGMAIINNGTLYGAQGASTTLSHAFTSIMDYVEEIKKNNNPVEMFTALHRVLSKEWKLTSAQVGQILGIPAQQVLDYFAPYNLPKFAQGTNFVPEDMVAQIHQGERIIPAADNVELMTNLGNRNRTNEVLVTEIKKLNQKIDSLERVVAEGAVINAEATNRNTEEISRTVKDTGSTASHSEAIRRRTQIV